MMTASVQRPEGSAKHFSDIHQLTDVLVLRTEPPLKVSETQLYITIDLYRLRRAAHVRLNRNNGKC